MLHSRGVRTPPPLKVDVSSPFLVLKSLMAPVNWIIFKTKKKKKTSKSFRPVVEFNLFFIFLKGRT